MHERISFDDWLQQRGVDWHLAPSAAVREEERMERMTPLPQLPDEIVRLHGEGLSLAEIAERTGWPQQRVRQIWSRVRPRTARAPREWGGEDPARKLSSWILLQRLQGRTYAEITQLYNEEHPRMETRHVANVYGLLNADHRGLLRRAAYWSAPRPQPDTPADFYYRERFG